ncbi:phosphatidylserine decarboxylase [bacterium]|nr:phosphatidylserine decarboxylase [bacterium]MBU3955328.1 phosphatidylserine decarboxylase [bacterium]MBU4134445.1 phosphatidylserine decarboxylase [bacterium]
MRISKEVIGVILPLGAIFAALAVPLFIPEKKNLLASWNFYAAAAVVLVAFWTLWFFRDPDIKINASDEHILSPASGRVLSIEETPHGTKIVRIFMNVCSYHIQRAPYAGKVREIKYTRGSFINAAKSDAHVKNERNEVVFDTKRGEIRVTQIVGSIARRILCWKNEGDSVGQGEKFGMIKFGSQVDCEFPDSCEILVKEGDRLDCAQSVIAKW